MAKTAKTAKKKERGLSSTERKKLTTYRKKLVAKSKALREKRRQQLDPDLMKQVEADEQAFLKVPLQSKTKYAEAAEVVNDNLERVFPLTERPIWVRAHAWWKYRKIRKQMLHHAKLSRSMREDLLDPELLAETIAAEKAFKKAPIVSDFLGFTKAGEELNKVVEKVAPPSMRSRAAENLEVAVVAIAVALGVRTYFLQPFKIPTGSMQPSLYGQTFEPGETKNAFVDKPWLPVSNMKSPKGQMLAEAISNPVRLFKGLFTGRWYREYRAPFDGVLRQAAGPDRMGNIPFVIQSAAGTSNPFYIHGKMIGPAFNCMPGQAYKKGDIISAGTKVSGDHILVNKMAYNFGNPKRGDIFVFSMRNIDYGGVNPADHYIKRLVGMPGEKIQVQNRRLVADGKVVTEPDVIRRNYLRNYNGSDRLYGKTLESTQQAQFQPLVRGYSNRWKVAGTDGFIQLSDEQYLPMGDNTDNSLDGRAFGGIHEDDVVGKASFIYWPFFRFGRMDRDIKHWRQRLDADKQGTQVPAPAPQPAPAPAGPGPLFVPVPEGGSGLGPLAP